MSSRAPDGSGTTSATPTGAWAGGATGALLGAVAVPVGAVTGAAIGAAAGSLADPGGLGSDGEGSASERSGGAAKARPGNRAAK